MQSYFSRLRLNVSSLKHVHKQKYLPMNQTLQNDDCWINCRVKKGYVKAQNLYQLRYWLRYWKQN